MADIFSSEYNKLTNIFENELITISKKQISNIIRLYKTLEDSYGKEYDKIKFSFEKQIMLNDNEIITKDNEIEKLNMSIDNLKMKSEIDNLKYQLAMSRLN